VIELLVGPVAHGGHCVARLDDKVERLDDKNGGRVVFVRNALPGERVRAVVTERRRGFWRADAIEVLEPSRDRVRAPCPYAAPGRCGGCDFQHARPAAARRLKAAVVSEQLSRLGGLADVDVDVQALPGGPLGWRTRVRYAVDSAGRLGFHRHRSHEVVPVDRCLIAHPAIQELALTARRWSGLSALEVVASGGGEVSVLAHQAGGGSRLVSGPEEVPEQAAGRQWTLPARVFWQVHPAAADALATSVLDLLAPQPDERAWDLYGGVGLFAATLAPHVREVVCIEGDRRAARAARKNLADLPQVRVIEADVRAALAEPDLRRVELVVLDPPRSGAGRAVVGQIVTRAPRAVAYVACDPAAFARDVATFAAHGYRLAALRAFDAFPMTHHVECVGLLTAGTG
jgi:tRNA/tmRNA/rRNA uracil-C5-methylase (TrmA/RlmC/RlmD family)